MYLGHVLVLTAAGLLGAEGQEQQPRVPSEMKVLEKLVGEWQEEREDVRAVSKATSILGGRFVQTKLYEDGQFVAIVMHTYDEARKQYRLWFFNAGGMTTQGIGKWDADSATLTYNGKTEDGSVWTTSDQFVNDNVVKMKFLMKDKNGEVLFDFERKRNRQLGADEDAEKWLKFFVGDWTRQRELQKDGEEIVVETATWSYKLSAAGTVGLSEGRWANGVEWVNISGSGPGKIHFERGINSSGIDWSIDYRKVDKNTLKGEFTGVAEGQKFKGTLTLAITGKNTYVAEWEAKSEDGKVTRARAVNTRVK